MTNAYKPILLGLMLTAALTSFGQKKIELTFDSGTNNIALPETPRIGLGGGVKWVVEHPRIKSFRIVEKPGNSRYIFSDPLPIEEDTKLEMRYASRSDDEIWQYNIEWTDSETGEKRVLDPKIAIKPGVGFTELIPLLGFIVTLATSILFYRKWQGAKSRLKDQSKKNTL